MQPRAPAAFALICDYVTNADPGVRAGAVLGLGLAYAGTRREEVAELLVPLVIDTDATMEVRGVAYDAAALLALQPRCAWNRRMGMHTRDPDPPLPRRSPALPRSRWAWCTRAAARRTSWRPSLPHS